MNAAQNRYLQHLTIFRHSRPLILRGETEPHEFQHDQKTMLEVLIDAERAQTSFCRVVRYLVYRVEQRGDFWLAVRYGMASLEDKIWLGAMAFRTREEAWTACDLWFRCDRENSMFAEYFSGIPEVPTHFLLRASAGYTDEDETSLSVEDFEKAFEARVNLERIFQPAWFQVCLELGFDAVVDEHDRRIRVARLKDTALNEGEIPNPLPPEFQDLEPELRNLVRRYKRFQTSSRKLLRKIQKDLVRHWLSSGYVFPSKRELAAIINQKHRTRRTPAAIARICLQLRLRARRPTTKPELFEREQLDDRTRGSQSQDRRRSRPGSRCHHKERYTSFE